MRGGWIDEISTQTGRLTFAALVALGLVVTFTLLYSVGNPKLAFIEFRADRFDILKYSWNTLILFLLSIAIQFAFFFWGTMYVRRLSNFAKVALILPFATGTIAPAIGLYTLFSSQIGPLNLSWLISDPMGSRLLIALIDAWQWTGVLLFLAFAFIERIPMSHFRQATLEGISRLQQWKLIVLPIVWRVAGIYVAIKALDWIRKFEIIRVLFGKGGPGEDVETFTLFAWTRYFDAGTQSYASLLALAQVLILLICVIVAFRISPIPNDIGRIWRTESTKPGMHLGERIFWWILSFTLIVPVLWLVSMSLQPSDVIYSGGFKLVPRSVTAENYLQFTLWNNANFFWDYVVSVIFYGVTTACAMLFALNETYQLAIHSNRQRERRHFAAVIGVFFLPTFAVFSAVELLNQWTSFQLDIPALITLSTVSSYALGFFAIYTAFKYGFHPRYEQLLLEFRSPALAFWTGIIRPQIWVVSVAAVMVFTTSWNELFLNDQWTSGCAWGPLCGWRPFAVVIGTALEQYTLKYSTIAAGAVISMVTPLLLGFLLYIFTRIPGALRGASCALRDFIASPTNRNAIRKTFGDG